jgi:D-beta-D-heptose 7-phosphate kinase/D-beta-D-heptose 1-phosphate adenosyltransferase
MALAYEGGVMTLAPLQALLARASSLRIACVGDLMIDRYVYGDVSRVSPEAPIPVMARKSEAVMLGGVGNVARNVAALGAVAALAGVVGDDAGAADAADLVSAEPGMRGYLVKSADRPTTVKTRFVAGGQQLLRLDSEDDTPLADASVTELSQTSTEAARGAQAIILSDYAKGAVTPALIQSVLAAAKASGAVVIVDPKGRSFAKYGPVDLIKPNAKELALVTDLPVKTDSEIEAALAAALAGCEAKAILVTRAGAGMSMAVRGEKVRHFAGRARAVFDVSGAGDTSIAALGLALAAGSDFDEAVGFALLASGVVVGKVGTATVSPAELIEAELASSRTPAVAKLASAEDAAATVARWKSQGLSVGFTNGCFDILHRGHVTYLAQAASWCDRLVVALNSDASVARLKGEGRPVNGLDSRAVVMASLASVDLVTSFDEETPRDLICQLRPDVLIKGADYSVDQIAGAAEVLGWGGRVQLADIVDGYSTTAAIKRMMDKA